MEAAHAAAAAMQMGRLLPATAAIVIPITSVTGAVRMTRLAALFERTRAQNRAALIGYFTAGDPTPVESLALLRAALPPPGIDALEVGVPFCDPVLDGETIQRAHRRALKHDVSLIATLGIVARFRDGGGVVPIILMGYYNPIGHGPDRFARAAAAAGVDAVIVADLPIHEATEELLPALAGSGIATIPLYAPNLEVRDYALHSPGLGGFLYCIPVAGPTGGASVPMSIIERAVTLCRANTRLPIGVGFGIKSPQAAAAVASVADGVIVGSALVRHIERWIAGRQSAPSALHERVGQFIAELLARRWTSRARVARKQHSHSDECAVNMAIA